MALQAEGCGIVAHHFHMNEELYSWLEKMFIRSNISKYRKYFHEWIENITEDQIIGFQRMMNANYVIKK